MSNSVCSQCGCYTGSGAMGTTLHQCLCQRQEQATPDKIESLEQTFNAFLLNELKLAKDMFTQAQAFIVKLDKERDVLEHKQVILIEALERECSCTGASNYVDEEGVLCDCCEALKKVGWVKK